MAPKVSLKPQYEVTVLTVAYQCVCVCACVGASVCVCVCVGGWVWVGGWVGVVLCTVWEELQIGQFSAMTLTVPISVTPIRFFLIIFSAHKPFAKRESSVSHDRTR